MARIPDEFFDKNKIKKLCSDIQIPTGAYS